MYATMMKNDLRGNEARRHNEKRINDTILKYTFIRSHKAFKYVLASIFLVALLSFSLVFALNYDVTQDIDVDEGCGIAHEVYESIAKSRLGTYKKFAVAADSGYCSTVGKNILEKNGSAIDSAIATGLCNSIMNAQSMGIGGGFFMTIYMKNENKAYIIDAREIAPQSADRDMFVNKSSNSRYSGTASGIPGEIKGYYEAYKIGGKLPWKDLLEPAINLCLNGFRISEILSAALKNSENAIKNNQELTEIYINKTTNSVYQKGDIIKMTKLGKTLQLISQSNNSDVFYNGPLTQSMVTEMNENGGNVSLEDFRKYNVITHVDRIIVNLDENYRVYVPPPPSSGILVPFIMKLMKGFNLTKEVFDSEKSQSVFYHRLIESMKHAYSNRIKMGDENFVDLKRFLEEMSNEDYINSIRKKINDQKTFASAEYGPYFLKDHHGTAHISVLAPNGDAVALTSTINTYFGAKYAGKYTGIIYNNQMDDFSTPGVANGFGFVPAEANFIEPGKRPLSSMVPLIVVDKKNNVRLIIGASGGSKIISAVAQVAIKTLWMGLDLKKSIDHRRLHHQLYPENGEFEVEFPAIFKNYLKTRGHKLSCFNYGGSVVQGVQVIDNQISAYSDPRKGGLPDGI